MLPWAFGDAVSAAGGGGGGGSADVVGDGGPVTGARFCFVFLFFWHLPCGK